MNRQTSPIFIAIIFAAAMAVTSHGDAQTRPTSQPAAPAQKIDTAIDAGLKYLAGAQIADGSFQPAGTKLQTSALSLLAFLSVGDMPDSGRYGGTVRRVTEFLLRQTPGDRYFGRVDGSRMRGQAIVTLALCEVYGVEPDEQTRVRLRATVKDAVAVIVAAQNLKPGDATGGWGDEPGAGAADPAVTLWCLMALRAAQQIGLNVPQQNLDRGEQYLQHNPPSSTTSAPATAPVQISPLILLDWLYREGDDAGFYPSPRWRSACQALLATQNSNGGWPGTDAPEESGGAAATAINLLILGAQDRLLPVFSG